jgi:Ca-activated chloride channel family protein
MFLSAMGPDLIPVPGTAIAEALRKSMAAYVQGENRNKILILITDGEDHEGELDEVVKQAVEAGVVVYTIGIGSSEGVPIPVSTETGDSTGFKRDEDGDVVLTRLDDSTLRSIARSTGGSYHRVSPGESELDAIYREIAAMEKKELSARQVTRFDEKFQLILAVGFLGLTTEFLIRENRRTKREWKGRFW